MNGNIEMQVEDVGDHCHPLLVTTRPHRHEDSVDYSQDDEGHRETDTDRYAQRVFGVPTVDTQGPAGSSVPDVDARRRRPPRFGDNVDGGDDPSFGYTQADDAPPDAAGPVPLVEVEMTESDFEEPKADAAAAAVAAAHRHGVNTSSAMLDALEAAEAAYEQQQQQLQPQQGQTAIEPGQQQSLTAPGGAAAPAPAGGGALPPDTPRKAAIPEGTRERIIQRLFESLQTNPRYSSEPSRDVQHLAVEVEDALFETCHSKQVYLSLVSNAVRLARTVGDAADIPRIAAGEPREVAEGHTAPDPTPYITGLQGYVLKPDMLA